VSEWIFDNLTLAIIRRPTFGVDDRGRLALKFSTYVSEMSAADQWLLKEEYEKAFKDSGVSDVSQLEGKPCWVDTSEMGLIKFVRMWKT